jgi:hypothetical protein
LTAKASNNPSRLNEVASRILEQKITKLQATFGARKGLSYERLQEYSFDEVESVLEFLKQSRIITSEVSDTVLKCPSCNSYKFSFSFVCRICESTNVARRPVIEHLPCGNIDFEENFQTGNNQDSFLLCGKCHKRLTAIGVDYAKPGYFFKCNSCSATLPNVENKYNCFECGKVCAVDELSQLPLYTHLVDLEKLYEFMSDHQSFLSPLIETLTRTGIRSALPGEVVGESKLKHTFNLVTYDIEGRPTLLADVVVNDVEIDQGQQKWNDDVVAVMAFYARCVDVSNLLASQNSHKKSELAKVLIAIPGLSQNASKLASTYGITVVQGPSKAETIPKIMELIVSLESNAVVVPKPQSSPL